MPAIWREGVEMLEKRTGALQAREWGNMGASGMTPTAFAFLIPVFVIVVFAPFVCVFCIKSRRQVAVAPAPKKAKKPALQRAEARERLQSVTEVSNIAEAKRQSLAGTIEGNAQSPGSSSASFAERECAICLSTLHAPSPPEPALLPTTTSTTTDAATLEAATRPGSINNTTPEPILKLNTCGHEFHAECLISWFVLRKTSCPICRAVYISKEEMGKYDEEAELEMVDMNRQGDVVGATDGGLVEVRSGSEQRGRRISNWRYFVQGNDVLAREGANAGQNREQEGGQRSPSWMFWRSNVGGYAEQNGAQQSGHRTSRAMFWRR